MRAYHETQGVDLMNPTIAFLCLVITSSLSLGRAQTPPPPRNYPAPIEGDYVSSNFHFKSGDVLPELKIHYRTIGTPKTDGSGVVRNAILIGHGTGGSGAQFLS